MPKVNVLSADVIAKIAAGEAVERPASVVKELLENSLDAGATSIEILLKDAGKELIHIKDNGCGISRENLEKLFQRHATSKLTAIEDLEKLLSMGFRGEALYSIAAVSNVVLSSRADQTDAWQIHMRGGLRQNLQPTALGHAGTDIKVEEIFFNTPARRKFLKSNTAELNQILASVLPYTLIYPDKRFVLTHAGRALLDLKTAPSQTDRIAAALNVDAKDLLQASQEFPDEQMTVRMTLGTINIQRPRRDLQFIFVNHRPVESKNLSFNLNDVYKLILPPGVWGCFILELSLDPANVDINIHPTKREVRLKNEGRIISLLRRMVEYQLMHHGHAKMISSSHAGGVAGLPADQIIFAPGQMQAFFNQRRSGPGGMAEPAPAYTDSSLRSAVFAQNSSLELPLDFQLFERNNTLRSKFSRAHFVGSFINQYLLFEADETLMIVDQHAAQERIMFEKFKNQIENSQVEIQPLLTPLVMKLTPLENLAWEEAHEQLEQMGIETTRFDADTIAVQTQPLLLKNIEASVRSLLAGNDVPRQDKNALARRACKASVTAGDQLNTSQADHQRRQLLECQDPFTCPHGRPTVIELNKNFLDRQFLRT